MSDLTRILKSINDGDRQASEALLPLVYEELRILASAKLAREKPGHTLQATALVHEAYLRLVGGEESVSWDGSGHFFAAAAEAMRRILVEAARKRVRREDLRGSRIALDELALGMSFPDDQLLRLEEALQRLELKKPLVAELVKLRFFAGLTMQQTAASLGISLRTAERNWTYARTWLHRELEKRTG